MEADDNVNLEEGINKFKSSIYDSVAFELQRLKALSESDWQRKLEASGDVQMVEVNPEKESLTAKICERKLIVDEDDKRIWEVEFQLSRPVKRSQMDVGSYISVWPQNDPEVCAAICEHFDWDPSAQT